MFGDVINGKMWLNDAGRVVRDEWLKTPAVRPNVRIVDAEFVVMPNHLHGIIWIEVHATRRVSPTIHKTNRPQGPQPGSIGAIIGQFKSVVTKRINRLRGTIGTPVWQRNYYERIIRDDDALHRIRQYIINNPARWSIDSKNPDTDWIP